MVSNDSLQVSNQETFSLIEIQSVYNKMETTFYTQQHKGQIRLC